MERFARLFSQNRHWATTIQREHPGFFDELSNQQHPDFLWIGCSDSRVPANQIVELAPGEVFVHRNVANVVDPDDLNCGAVVQYAIDHLKVEHVLVVGHYGCGGVQAALCDMSLGLADQWLEHVHHVKQKHYACIKVLPDQKAQHDRLCELNVIEQVRNLCSMSVIRDAWARDQVVMVHGCIYGLEDGLIRDLGVSCKSPDEVEPHCAAAIAHLGEPHSSAASSK